MSAARHLCFGCGLVRTANPLCPGCASAQYDTESPWDLEPYSRSETISRGYWRQRRGIKEWVPLIASAPEPMTGDERRCKGCPGMFRPGHALQRYCTRQCSKRARYQRVKDRAGVPVKPAEVKAADRAMPLPKTNTLRQFTDDECRDGRARYAQGDRSPTTLAQSREYGRVMKAARRRAIAEANWNAQQEAG